MTLSTAKIVSDAWSIKDYVRVGCASLGTAFFLALTATWWLGSEEGNVLKIQHALNHNAEEAATSILASLKQYEQILRSVKGFVEGSDDVSADEFHAFIAAQKIESSMTGLQGVALVLSVPGNEKDRHVDAIRHFGVPGYQIRPSGKREAYAPIVYIESNTPTNAKVIGLDVLSIPEAKAAIERARDTSDVAVSEKLLLGQDIEKAQLAGYVMYLSIRRHLKSLDAAKFSSDKLFGWADATFRTRDLLTTVSLGLEKKGIRLQLFDGESTNAADLSFAVLDGEESPYQEVDQSPYLTKKNITFGGQKWTLVVEPSNTYLAQNFDKQHHFIALIGVALSFAVGLIIWLLLSARDRAIGLATQMTKEIHKLSSEMDDTLNAIPDLLFELSLDGTYEGYRAHSSDLLAAPPSVFIGKKVEEILPFDAAQICLNALVEANQTGFSSGKKIRLPIGETEKWFELSVAKRMTIDASPPRFVMLSREVTERVISAELLERSEGALTQAQRVAGLGHFWVDIQTRRLTAAPACYELLGFESNESLDLSMMANLVEPRMRKSFLNACLHEDPLASHDLQFRLTRPDGQTRWMLMCSAKMDSRNSGLQSSIFTLQDISKLRYSEDQLRLLEKAISEINDIVLITEAEPINEPGPRILFVNDAFVRRTGYSREEVLGRSPKLLQGPETQKDELARIRTALENWHPVRAELINYTKGGTPFWLELDIQPIANAEGWFTHWVAIERDITDRKQIENNLRESEVRYRSMFEGNPHPMWVFDTETLRFLSVNDAAVRLYGYSRQEFLEMTLKDIRSSDEQLKFEPQFAIDKNLSSTTAQVWRHLKKDGSEIAVEISGNALNYRGISARLILATDITERRKVEAEIAHLAYYDPLTQLPNRTVFFTFSKSALIKASENRTLGACILIDLDNFKTINDDWGHRTGDNLLKQVSQRIRKCVPQEDLVARLGGDEFAIVLTDAGADTDAAATTVEFICENILATLAMPYTIDGREYYTSGSLGISIFGAHTPSVDESLSQADAAMYQAKADGRGTFRFFNLELQSVLAARSALEADLRQSINRNELTLVYQPQVDRYGHTVGVEALIRWSHAVRGLVSPAEFIPLAESSGFILKIGQWVLHTACTVLSSWKDDPVTMELTIAVNVSARQFYHPDFVSQVESTLLQTGANPKRLKLEMTESMLASDLDSVVQKMTSLKFLGITFSLDDFGTGYSSLAYLKKLPIDQLKIDQSFVREILQDTNDAAIVRTVIALGDLLGLQVIAEGVETKEQRDFLERNDCFFYQGYLYSRPVPVYDFIEFVQKEKNDTGN